MIMGMYSIILPGVGPTPAIIVRSPMCVSDRWAFHEDIGLQQSSLNLTISATSQRVAREVVRTDDIVILVANVKVGLSFFVNALRKRTIGMASSGLIPRAKEHYVD